MEASEQEVVCTEGLVVLTLPRWPAGGEEAGSTAKLSEQETEILKAFVHNFKGVAAECQAWPSPPAVVEELCHGGLLECGLVPGAHLELILPYFSDASRKEPCWLLYLHLLYEWQKVISRDLPRGFEFRGYDYGYYLGSENHFSAIANDVVLGQYEDLRRFEGSLNGSFLLPTMASVRELAQSRERLILRGASLELDEWFVPIAVYSPTDPQVEFGA
jgi:hypothetical protein